MSAKRAFDLVVSLLGLAALCPVFLAIAALIKLDSSGPVFFRQERVGRFGTTFLIYKFRTMIVNAEAEGPKLTVKRDPRITRIGQFLRRYKLDELPQLINVIRGEMSLVGPRPEVPRYVAAYPETSRKIVLSVSPGITDYASIKFRDESALLATSADPERTYVEEILPLKLRLYEEYVARRTLWLDIRLICGTLFAVFKIDES